MKIIIFLPLLILLAIACVQVDQGNVEVVVDEPTPTEEQRDTETKECQTEQDCIESGKCSTGLECTCANNICYTGLVAIDECTSNEDCPDNECNPPADPLCFSTSFCNSGKCTCVEGCA